MKAIILAAGYGSRMYPLTQDKPKCLLTINNETLLARQLRILKGYGIEDVTVVTGFYQSKIVELYGKEVAICYNPHYEITGSIFSLWTARELLNDDVIILNADVVFTKEPIEALLIDDNPYCLVVDNREALDTEDQRVKVEGGNIIEVSKSIPIDEAYGEAIGIARIKKGALELFKSAMFECVKRDSNDYWLSIFQNIAERNRQVKYILVDSLWAENDTEEEYQKARIKFAGK